MSLALADSQLAASSGSVLAVERTGMDRWVDIVLFNTNTSDELVVITKTTTNGTRVVAKANLSTLEALYIRGLAVGGGDSLNGFTTNASKVDCTITESASGTLFEVVTVDANGARKTSQPTQGGNIGFTGRVTTTDGVSGGTAKVVGGMAFSDVAASDTVTAVASNNSFVSFAQSYSIPANTLKAGTKLRIRAQVTVNDASGSDTLTCNIRLGGTSLIASTAVNPGATTDHHILEFEVTARAAPGAAASCAGWGEWKTNTGGTMATASAILAPANFATNGALVVDVQAKWSSNTASTSARLEILDVEIL